MRRKYYIQNVKYKNFYACSIDKDIKHFVREHQFAKKFNTKGEALKKLNTFNNTNNYEVIYIYG